MRTKKKTTLVNLIILIVLLLLFEACTIDWAALNPSSLASNLGARAQKNENSALESTLPKTYLSSMHLHTRYMNIHPQQVYCNQPVTISTNVFNSSVHRGHGTIVLKINGEMEAMREVSISSRSSQPVKFIVYKSQPGTYSVTLGEESGTFTVLGARGTFNASGNMVLILIAILALIVLLSVLIRIAIS